MSNRQTAAARSAAFAVAGRGGVVGETASRPSPAQSRRPAEQALARCRTGTPELDEGWAQAYEAAVARLTAAGAFVAEHSTAVGNFVDKLIAGGGKGLVPTVAGIITPALGANRTSGSQPLAPGARFDR